MTDADQSGTEAARVPAGAIQVNRRLYMVPVGVDADGCEQFTPFSPGGMTNQAIHYRMPDGRFELSKDVTACRVEMVALGPDEDGCERFQAKAAGGLPPTDVAYYRTADGGYVAHKDRAACPAQR